MSYEVNKDPLAKIIADDETAPPFDITTHLKSPDIDNKIAADILELRKLLADEELYTLYRSWCTDQTLHRFLIARQYNVKASASLLAGITLLAAAIYDEFGCKIFILFYLRRCTEMEV